MSASSYKLLVIDDSKRDVLLPERLLRQVIQAGALDYFRKDELNSSLLGKAIRQAIERARLIADATATAAHVSELEATVARLEIIRI